MTDLSRTVSRLRRTIALLLAARFALIAETRWFLAWGVAALALRYIGVPTVVCVAAGAATALAVAIVSIVRGVRAVPAAGDVAALMDSRLNCGGLLAASSTVPLGAWSPSALLAAPPRVVWKPRRHLVLLAMSSLFVAASLLVPINRADAAQRVNVADDVKRLEDRVALLEEEKVVPPERAETFREALESAETTAAGDVAKAWETLDTLEEETSRLGAEAGEDGVRDAQSLAEIEAASSALDGAGLAASDLANAMGELAAEVSRVAAENETLQTTLSPELEAAIAKNALTAEQLKKLGAAAGAAKGALRNRMSKLGRGGLLDPKTLRRFDDAASSVDRDALARYLKENAKRSLKEGIGSCRRPGQGGVDRGRGDAEMYFGELSEEGGKFKDQILPPGSTDALADSDLAAVTAGAPAPDSERQPAASTGQAMAPGNASATTNVVMPRHRGTVTRFFERKKQ